MNELYPVLQALWQLIVALAALYSAWKIHKGGKP